MSDTKMEEARQSMIDSVLSFWEMAKAYAEAVDAGHGTVLEEKFSEIPASLWPVLYDIGSGRGDMRGMLQRPDFRQVLLSKINDPTQVENSLLMLGDDTFLDSVVMRAPKAT